MTGFAGMGGKDSVPNFGTTSRFGTPEASPAGGWVDPSCKARCITPVPSLRLWELRFAQRIGTHIPLLGLQAAPPMRFGGTGGPGARGFSPYQT